MIMGKRANSRTISRLIVVFLVLLAFAWRIQGLSRHSLWRDEIDTIFFALNDLPALLSMFAVPGDNGTLYFLLLRPWLRLAGSSELALRYPSVLFGVLSVPLFWQVGRRLMPVRGVQAAVGAENGSSSWQRYPRATLQVIFGSPALLATVFLVFNPYQLWYSQEGRMYTLATLLVLLAAWLWLQGIGRGGWRFWLGYLLTITAALFVHRVTILLIPLGFLWFILAWPQSKGHWKGYILALAGLTIPFLPVAWWQRNLLLSSVQWTGLDFIPFPQVLESILVYQNQGISAQVNTIGLVPIFFLVLVGLLLGYKAIFPDPTDPLPKLSAFRRYLLIVGWYLLPPVALYIVSLWQPLFLPRYLIWIAPAALMLMALGVQLFWQRNSPFTRSLAMALALYVLIFWIISGWQLKSEEIKTDLRGAVSYVSQHRQPGELLILQIPHLEFAYRYYSGDQGSSPFEGSDDRLGWWTGGTWTNNELDDEDAMRGVDEEMHEKTAGARGIWVISSESETWDSRGLMDEWLDDNATLFDETHFSGSRVSGYHFDSP